MESDNRNGAHALAYGLVGFVPMFGLLFGVLSIVKGIAGMNLDESRKLFLCTSYFLRVLLSIRRSVTLLQKEIARLRNRTFITSRFSRKANKCRKV